MTLAVPTLETERLILRGWRADDFGPMADFYANSSGVAFVGGPLVPIDAWRRMIGFAGHWSLYGVGLFAIEEKSTGTWAGYCGLWQPPDFPEMELSYSLADAHRGKGYLTEAGAAALRYAFTTAGRTTLVSYILDSNLPSQRVAERLGAKLDGTAKIRDFTANVWRYSRPAEPSGRSAPTS